MNTKSNAQTQFPRTSIIDFVNSITFDDCVFFDFTQEVNHSKATTSDVLPLPRGGDFLHLLDVVNAPILDENQEVDYWVTGVIRSWNNSLVTIEDNDGTFHYATMESVEEAAELIAAAITSEGYSQFEQELYEYVSEIAS